MSFLLILSTIDISTFGVLAAMEDSKATVLSIYQPEDIRVEFGTPVEDIGFFTSIRAELEMSVEEAEVLQQVEQAKLSENADTVVELTENVNAENIDFVAEVGYDEVVETIDSETDNNAREETDANAEETTDDKTNVIGEEDSATGNEIESDETDLDETTELDKTNSQETADEEAGGASENIDENAVVEEESALEATSEIAPEATPAVVSETVEETAPEAEAPVVESAPVAEAPAAEAAPVAEAPAVADEPATVEEAVTEPAHVAKTDTTTYVIEDASPTEAVAMSDADISEEANRTGEAVSEEVEEAPELCTRIVELAVSWKCKKYNPNSPGEYIFEAELPDNYEGMSIDYSLIEKPTVKVIVLAPEYVRETTVGDVVIRLYADEGVLPVDSSLFAKAVESESELANIEEAVDEVRNEDVNITQSMIFDIKVFDGKRNEIQPDLNRGNVYVEFENTNVSNVNLDTNVYHIHDKFKIHGSRSSVDFLCNTEYFFIIFL